MPNISENSVFLLIYYRHNETIFQTTIGPTYGRTGHTNPLVAIGESLTNKHKPRPLKAEWAEFIMRCLFGLFVPKYTTWCLFGWGGYSSKLQVGRNSATAFL